MKVGFLSDAHGNITATALTVGKMRELGLDEIYFLGDAIGYMPDGAAVLELLEHEGIRCVMGNHDAMGLGRLPIREEREAAYRLTVYSGESRHSHLLKIAGPWPIRRELEFGGKKFLLVHGRPANELEGYLYEDGAIGLDETGGYDVIVMGQTHRPYVRNAGGTLLINAGSCGLPRDIGNLPSFAVYDCDNLTAQIHRVEIDVESVIDSWASGDVHESVLACLRRQANSKGE
jgi:putative phosphoesterase